MEDKSPLERDLEIQEMYRIPLGIYILIILLVVGLGVAGVYALKLKNELLLKEQEIVLEKESFQKEKVELVGKIKGLEADIESISRDKEKRFPNFRRKALKK